MTGKLTLSNTAEALSERHLTEKIKSTHFKPFDHIDTLLVHSTQWADFFNKRVCAPLYDGLLGSETARRKGCQEILFLRCMHLHFRSASLPTELSEMVAWIDYLRISLTTDASRLEARPKHIVEVTLDEL